MSKSITKNKTQVVDAARKSIAATTKHLGGVAQVTLAGSSYTPAEITSTLQSLIDLHADVDAAKVTTSAKVAAENAQITTVVALISALRDYVRVNFGGTPEVLADFGAPRKTRAQVSPETQVVAAAKRKATR